MFNKLQQEQRDLDASYRQSLQNKKEHETRDQDQDNNASFEDISEAEYNKRHMKALKDADPGLKPQASSNKGVLTCRAKNCTNSLYKWTSSKDPRYCVDCL